MSSLLGKARNAVRRDGFFYAIRKAIPHLHKHYLREYFPRTSTQLNGVTVRKNRLFDSVVPWEMGRSDPENYESAIVSNLRSHVKSGDSVVIVGGGWGISTVVAAKRARERGSVQTYEASPKFAEYTRETTRLNGVAERCTVKNAVVSHTISTQGDTASNIVIPPTELPDCDVLELDCEGAELEILRQLQIRPRVIIVETHGVFDAPTDDVESALKELSYEVLSKEIADRGLAEMHQEQDVRVLTAQYDG